MEQNEQILKLFKQKMRNYLGDHLKQLILFGSRARGDSSLESDYDCLAVFDEVTPEITGIIDEVAGEILFQYNAVFSIFPISEKRRVEQTYNPFLLNINNEGIIL